MFGVLKSCLKDLLFLTCLILNHEVALCQDGCLSLPKLLNLFLFGNLFLGDFFSVDFFFTQSRSMDSMSIVA